MNNTLLFQQASQLLIQTRDLLSSSLKEAVEKSLNGQGSFFSFLPSEKFVRRQAGGASSIYEILDSSTEKKNGICNFENQGYMAPNEAMIVQGIALDYGLGNDGDSAGSIAYTTAHPAELANAELVIMQDGTELVRLSAGLLKAAASPTNPNEKYYELPSLLLLRDDREVKANLLFSSGDNLPAAAGSGGTTPFISVSLRGLITRKK